MAAGVVSVSIIDGTGTPRTTRWWSDDGTLQGNLTPFNHTDLALENAWSYAAGASGIVSSTSDVVAKAAGAGSVINYVTRIELSSDALSAAAEFVIKDGSTVLWRHKFQTAALPGFAVSFDPPLKGTAATAVNIAMLSSVTGGVYANLQGYSA